MKHIDISAYYRRYPCVGGWFKILNTDNYYNIQVVIFMAGYREFKVLN